MSLGARIDVSAPLWDQSTFYGRFRHFFWMTNPLNCVYPGKDLEHAKQLLQQYKMGKEPPGTSRDQIHHAMKLYMSSFHPDSGDLQNIFGRMSFQVPGGMAITGAMLQFYKSVPQVVFWQWFNQSFNALVNYTNRNAEADISLNLLGFAYFSATFSALGTAIGLKRLLESRAPPLFQRFVPMMAVAAANCVNIPLMRQVELAEGVDLRDENGNKVCKSRYAASKGISQVVLSRNVIMAPGMFLMPFVMQAMEKKPWFAKRTMWHAPFQVMCVGAFLVFMVPVGCALFPQTCSVTKDTLRQRDASAYEQLKTTFGKEELIPDTLYFNKGL